MALEIPPPARRSCRQSGSKRSRSYRDSLANGLTRLVVSHLQTKRRGNSHAPAHTDRPYRASFRGLGPIFRDSLGFIHRLQKTAPETKRAGSLPPFFVACQRPVGPQERIVHVSQPHLHLLHDRSRPHATPTKVEIIYPARTIASRTCIHHPFHRANQPAARTLHDFNVSFLGPTEWRVCASQPYCGNCDHNSSDFLWEREIPAFRGTPESATYLWSPPHNDP